MAYVETKGEVGRELEQGGRKPTNCRSANALIQAAESVAQQGEGTCSVGNGDRGNDAAEPPIR